MFAEITDASPLSATSLLRDLSRLTGNHISAFDYLPTKVALAIVSGASLVASELGW
jgi:hypothetical protein